MDYQDLQTKAHEALERSEKATEGPWYSSNDAVPRSPKQKSPFEDQGAGISTHPDEDCWGGNVVQGGMQDEQGGAVGVLSNEDAEFIAHARTDVPTLSQAVLELIGKCRELEQRNEQRRTQLAALSTRFKRAEESWNQERERLVQESGRMREALEHARLDLVALHGLYIHDGAAPDEVWQLDNNRVIAHLDRALGEDV